MGKYQGIQELEVWKKQFMKRFMKYLKAKFPGVLKPFPKSAVEQFEILYPDWSIAGIMIFLDKTTSYSKKKLRTIKKCAEKARKGMKAPPYKTGFGVTTISRANQYSVTSSWNLREGGKRNKLEIYQWTYHIHNANKIKKPIRKLQVCFAQSLQQKGSKISFSIRCRKGKKEIKIPKSAATWKLTKKRKCIQFVFKKGKKNTFLQYCCTLKINLIFKAKKYRSSLGTSEVSIARGKSKKLGRKLQVPGPVIRA